MPERRSLGGALRSRGQITIGIALDHSTPLPFPAQFACALFVLDIAGDGAKSAPDRQSQARVAAKKTRKKPGGLACEGAGRSCMDGASRGLACGAGKLRKTRLRSIGPPLFPTSKRRRVHSCFDDRNNVSRKERSAGTQAVACQGVSLIYTGATLGLGQFALLGHQQ